MWVVSFDNADGVAWVRAVCVAARSDDGNAHLDRS